MCLTYSFVAFYRAKVTHLGAVNVESIIYLATPTAKIATEWSTLMTTHETCTGWPFWRHAALSWYQGCYIDVFFWFILLTCSLICSVHQYLASVFHQWSTNHSYKCYAKTIQTASYIFYISAAEDITLKCQCEKIIFNCYNKLAILFCA